MTMLELVHLSLLQAVSYDEWRVEFKRCQAQATIAGYRRDKALLEAAIRTEKAAIAAIRKEWKEHTERAKAQGRSAAFIKALVDEYGGSASKHKHELYQAEYALDALETEYKAAREAVRR